MCTYKSQFSQHSGWGLVLTKLHPVQWVTLHNIHANFIFRKNWFVYCSCIMYEQSTNHISLTKIRPRCYAKSSTAQDAFWSIPGLISFAGVIGRWPREQNAVRWLPLLKGLYACSPCMYAITTYNHSCRPQNFAKLKLKAKWPMTFDLCYPTGVVRSLHTPPPRWQTRWKTSRTYASMTFPTTWGSPLTLRSM